MLYLIIYLSSIILNYFYIRSFVKKNSNVYTVEDRVQVILVSLFSVLSFIVVTGVAINEWCEKNKDKPIKW